MRNKIHDELEKFINETNRTKFSQLLDQTENWLYEDGEDLGKQAYLDKLKELKVNKCKVGFGCLLFSFLGIRKSSRNEKTRKRTYSGCL